MLVCALHRLYCIYCSKALQAGGCACFFFTGASFYVQHRKELPQLQCKHEEAEAQRFIWTWSSTFSGNNHLCMSALAINQLEAFLPAASCQWRLLSHSIRSYCMVDQRHCSGEEFRLMNKHLKAKQNLLRRFNAENTQLLALFNREIWHPFSSCNHYTIQCHCSMTRLVFGYIVIESAEFHYVKCISWSYFGEIKL